MSERKYELRNEVGLYYIYSPSGGSIPKAISGGYTSTTEAYRAMERHAASCFKPPAKPKPKLKQKTK